MEWKTEDILKVVAGGGFFTLLSTIIARAMGWIRFGKADKARVGKVQAETALDIATITQKKISDEVKISDAALQWTVNLATQLEKANAMIEKKQTENDRLHGIIDVMKRDFEREFQKLKDDFNQRIKELEKELERSRDELIQERSANREEIKKLKAQIDGN